MRGLSMLYNNKKTLSALALILAMSISLAGKSYAQGVITLVDENVDELGLQNADEQAAVAENLDVAVMPEDQDNNAEEVVVSEENNLPFADYVEKENIEPSTEIPLEINNSEPAWDDLNAEEVKDFEPMNLDQGNVTMPDNSDSTASFPVPTAPSMNPNANNVAGNRHSKGDFPAIKGRPLPKRDPLAEKQAEHEAEIEKLSELGNSVLSQIDNELFSQMSDIEKQTTLLSLELRREKLKSEIAAIKAARQQAEEKAEEEKVAREQRKKDMVTEKEIEKIKEQQLLEDKKIALEALRQEKALNDYRNKMLENEQKWINENQKLYNKMQEMDEERKAIISSFAEKLEGLNTESQSVIKAAETAKQTHNKVVANLNMQNEQLKKRLEAETSVGKSPFGDADANGQLNEGSLNKDYVIMEIRGKGEDLVAKLINKSGESFLVKKGSVLQSGHKIEKITHNYITLDKKGVKDYLQFTAGGILDKEPESSDLLSKSGNLKDAVMSRQPNVSSRPPLLTDTSIPSLGNGMFVK